MKRFNIQEFPEAFSKIGIHPGDVLFVHSRLFSFGIPKEVKLRALPSNIFEYLCKEIGKEGTLAVPAFNFGFCEGASFNRQRTPADASYVGIFSEFIRKLPQSKRSFYPMQSIAVTGNYANYIVEMDTETAFTPGGAFDRLRQLDGKILLIGATVNNTSFIHYVEEKQLVPYRYWKTFTGLYTDQNKTTEKTYKMYVRDLETNPKLQLNAIEKELRRNNQLKEAQIGSGKVQAFKIADFIAAAERFIQKNPYFFVSNHPKFGKC